MEHKEVNNSPEIKWNPNVKLILADIDDTIVAPYEEASPEMIQGLSGILEDGVKIFFVTGGGLQRAQKRIIEKIPQKLRSGILIAHCSGSEIWGHDNNGHLKVEPYYSLLDQKLTDKQQDQWREVVNDLVDSYGLKTSDPVPEKEFVEQTNGDPRVVMYDDRGPQITLELPNSVHLTTEQARDFGIETIEGKKEYDLREGMIEKARKMLKDRDVPINPDTGGMFALDFMLEGVSKTTAVEYALNNDQILESLGLSREDVGDANNLEAWGDRYAGNGGDNGMVKALPKGVRALNFRKENPVDFNPDYNIVLWNGSKQLAGGCLEYIQSRKAS
jgi:hydroxymethylpyrimidine pyrophosphatase-like HAD family hydrolase